MPSGLSTTRAEAAAAAPRGPVRDLIRATLGLGAERAVGKIEARQALLMALLGSCRMNPLARFLHDHMPEQVARDLKSLVERNCITISDGRSVIDVPLCADPQGGSAGTPLVLDAQGLLADGSAVHALPGLQAALHALGVAHEQIPQAVAASLARLGASRGEAITCMRLIEDIAAQMLPPERLARRIALAQDAYAGVEQVRLLSAWEATFTSAAHHRLASRHRDRLRHAVLHGGGSEDGGLVAKAAQIHARLAAVNRNFKTEAAQRLREAFIAELDTAMDERLALSFAPGAPAWLTLEPAWNDEDEDDESSCDAPAAALVVTSADAFKAMLLQLLQQAAARTIAMAASSPAERRASEELLKPLVQSLGDHVTKAGDNEFLLRLAAAFAAEEGTTGEEAQRACPWKLDLAQQMLELAELYFGKPLTLVSSAETQPSSAMQPQDAGGLLRFVLDTLAQMRSTIGAEVARSPQTYRVPLIVGEHMFSLTPGSYLDGWNGAQGATEWLEQQLQQPARAHVQAARSAPALPDLLADIVTLVHHNQPDIGFPQMPREELLRAIPLDDAGCYTLQAVFDALAAPGVYPVAADPDGFLDVLAAAILQVEPPPTIELADTHLDSPTGKGTDRIGMLYNPLRDTYALHEMDATGDGRAPLRQAWLQRPWQILTTPLHEPGDAGATVG